MSVTVGVNSVPSHSLHSSGKGVSTDLVKQAEKIKGVYDSLCREAQEVHYKNGYVPDKFVKKVELWSQADAGKINFETLRKGLQALETTPTIANTKKRPREESSTSTIQPNPPLRKKARDQTAARRASSEFGQEIQVPGDGNCGLHSMAVGMVKTRKGFDRLRSQLERLPDSRDHKTVLAGLANLNTDRDSLLLLADRTFMDALANVLREIGNTQIIARSPNSSVSETLIPQRKGQWVSDEGLLILAEILGLNVRIDETMHGQYVPTGELQKQKIDFVIHLSGAHFTPYVK